MPPPPLKETLTGTSTSTSSNDSLSENSSEVSHTLSEWDSWFGATEADSESESGTVGSSVD